MVRRIPIRWFVAMMLLSLHAFATAQVLDSLVMPGKVIEGHAKIEADCKSCHLPFKKTAQSSLCLDCHKDVAADVKAKKGFHGKTPDAVGKDCKTCHTDHKGRAMKIAAFDHASFKHQYTDYPLNGAHAKVECKSCHKSSEKFRDAPSGCNDCHKKDDVHKGSLGAACADCHNEKTWKEAKFDHDKTRFTLTGKHITTTCKKCHTDTNYKETPRTCIGCHKKDDAHKGRYGDKCDTCHDAKDWKQSTFSHARQGHWALLGKHANAKCDACHRAPLYAEKLSNKCISCHRSDDVHKGSLGEKCESCHNERSWKTTKFDHNRDTKFALYNKHKDAKCESCHKNGGQEKLPVTCISCHLKEDNQKGHKGNFGKQCESCHGDAAWKPSTFDHTKSTRYPLKFEHAVIKCEACHIGKLYEKDGAKLPGMTCLACHEKDDVHKGQEGKLCENCHDEKTWKKAKFDHNKSSFPLLGAHYAVKCDACHRTQKFKDAPSTCVGCHEKEDEHKKTLGAQCDSCHSVRSWKTWDFDHTAQTKYRLEGAHAKVTCIACHKTAAPKINVLPAKMGGARQALAKIAPTPQLCFSCHATDDKHDGNFGQQCDRCHVVSDWKTLKRGVTRGAASGAPDKN